jgi:error-prone DNA polymerase
MPQAPNPKLRPAVPSPASGLKWRRAWQHPYAELDVLTNFSFLRGASHPDELVYHAAQLGHAAIGIADINSVAGMVRAHMAAKEVGIPLCVGARLRFTDSPDVLVWAADRGGYANLCQLLTLGKSRAAKASCTLQLNDLLKACDGLWAALVPQPIDRDAVYSPYGVRVAASALREALGHRLSLTISRHSASPADAAVISRIHELSRSHHIPLLASNQVHYHTHARRPLQDVLTCVRHGCTIHSAGFRLFSNAERCLKEPAEMHHLFRDHPAALRRSIEIAQACTFTLDELRYQYPREVTPAGPTASEHLADLTWAGAADRYPDGVPEKVRRQVEQELAFIASKHLEAYFLTVHDLVRFARSQDILCQGRGSAANSAVCYCLGVTSVNPDKIDVLFERFLSNARNEPPDIDVDFEHERREEVIQYVYQKYGRDRAAMTANVITYRGRSAVRDVGKAMGLSLDMVDQMAKRLDWWDKGTLSTERVREVGLDPADRTVRQVLRLTSELLGFPRHLSQHVGGMVISDSPLCEIVPIENAAMEDRTVIEWDKDDINALHIMKVDILALGMLTAIAKAMKMVNSPRHPTKDLSPSPGAEDDFGCEAANATLNVQRSTLNAQQKNLLQLHTIPAEDPGVYEMISDADTVGVFQIESRAQMSMLPRLKPNKFYDLVIEVAIVRPGPIQGDMVHPYLRRRDGIEPAIYPKAELKEVLERTLGVPLFQEQAMKLAMVAAGFTAEEADRLRRAMASWRFDGSIEKFHDQIVEGMVSRGYPRDFAEKSFQQIKGFSGYGFPESHAASFALMVYASAWLKRYHPAAFCAALLNSQPMGFYAPAQLVRDARDHGVEIRPVDVNHSDWHCTLEIGGGSPHAQHAAGSMTAAGASQRESARSPRWLAPAATNRVAPACKPLRLLPPGLEDKHTWGHHGPAVRLGLRMVKGLNEDLAQRIITRRSNTNGFHSIDHFHRITRLPVATVNQLARADAFGSLDRTRRPAVWDTLALPDERLPLQDPKPPPATVDNTLFDTPLPAPLPAMPLREEIQTDYGTISLSLKGHPVGLLREALAERNIIPAAQLPRKAAGRWVSVAGLVLIRQRPGTASGIVFVTMEDETGVVNLIIRPHIYDRFRPAARYATLLQADGPLERQGKVQHVLAERLIDLSKALQGYDLRSRDFH